MSPFVPDLDGVPVREPVPSGVSTVPEDVVADAVARFTDLYGDALAVPAIAHDMCVPVSEAFVEALTEAGVSAQVVSGVRMGEFNGTPVLLNGHFAVQVGDEVYDWTARQFDESASVPLVESLSLWRKRWPLLGSPGAVDNTSSEA